ncbi:type VI secretion system Vgr family protein [Hymenobacter volaticus]|uniref:Phage baseplate assembly protein V n=1 Tax=Hymenobacter volaticus TaxID=2932254 RepID=A0ABY4GD49_9BACT|nr:contractile injection system protein, VgrG/Pvc8 family [Hymenobacter volaticus]UOQ68848.1 phage baseplate assembly protein V [Hymenobacter volaticus]
MSRQVTSTVQCAGSALAPSADIQQISLTQSLFSHHIFQVVVPFDRVEGSKVSFFSQAHKRLLGQPLSLAIEADSFHFNQGQKLLFKGVVTHLEAGKDNDFAGSVVARGYSPCYLLASGAKKRTFVAKTLDAIFNEVLQPYPANLLARKINPQHKAPLPYVVQYRETNFEFLSRLAAEYGEWFYYDGEALQLGTPASSEEIEFVADGDYNSFSFGMTLVPTKAKMYEYNYQKHQHFKSTTSSQSLPSLQNHPYGGFALAQAEKLFTDEAHTTAETWIDGNSQLDEEAKLLKANVAASLVSLQGFSDNPNIHLGSVLNVSGEGIGTEHLTPESFGKYRILEITHFIDEVGNYSNQFSAIPHVLEVPPLNPHYDAPQGTPELAEVINDKDPEKLGRLRVRYHWPVDNPQQAETDWVRLLTPYSGSGKGQLFKPEVGSQVLVDYQGGLAEQPFILGNMFHANNKQGAKYSPDQNLMKGIQTAGGNKFVMQDKSGEQKILISNSNNKGTAVEVGFNGDGSISIKTNGPISLTAGGDITLDAKKDITLTAGNNITITAKKNVMVTAQEEAVALDAKMALDMVAEDLTADFRNNLTINASAQAKIKSQDTDII